MIGETDQSTYKPALTYHPLANLFPMIEGPERVAFRQSIRDKGLRVRIVMHEGMILDGRNRYRELLGLQLIDHSTDWKASPYFRTFGSEETDGDDPLSFVLDLNLDRRHLNESQRASVAARMATMKRDTRSDLKEGSSLGEAVETISRAEAAERLNVSERSVTSAKKVQDQGAPELIEAVDQGVLPVSVAEKLLTLPVQEQARLVTEETPAVIKNAAKKATRSDKEQKLAAKQKALPNKLFGVIYGDPAWRFEPRNRETGLDRAADNHYPTMTTEEIIALQVGDIAAPDSVCFLWVPVPHLLDGLRVLKAYGFEYKSHCIWDKTPWDGDGADAKIAGRQGNGFWFRVNHEILLVGTRGTIPAPAPGENFPSVYREVAGEHSAKPEYFARMIEKYYPSLAKIELNARAPRRGWDVWGNESDGKEVKPGSQRPQAQNLYVAELNNVPLETYRFRSTPNGQPSVADLVAPGTIISTSYGSGPYIVVRRTGPHWYAPDRGAFKCGITAEEADVATDRVFSYYSLGLTLETDFLAKPTLRALKGDASVNELVAVDGRLLKLFEANTDETFVTGFNAEAARLLGASTEPPPGFVSFVQADPRPDFLNKTSCDPSKAFVTPAELLEYKVITAIALGIGGDLDGPIVQKLIKDGDAFRDGGRIDLTKRGWGTAELLKVEIERATIDDIVNVVDVGGVNGAASTDRGGVSSVNNDENLVNADYIATLEAVAPLRGKLHQSTAAAVMQAAYAAEPPIPVAKLAQDLGHPVGTVKTWANRLGLTSRDRMLAAQERAPAFSSTNQPFNQLADEVPDINGDAVKAGLKVTLTEDVVATTYEVRRVYKNGNISISNATGHQQMVKAGEFVLASEASYDEAPAE